MKTCWTRFNKYLYNYWRLQAAVIFLGLVMIPLSLLNPYLAKLIIDKAYGNKDLKLFLILAILGGSIFVLNGLIESLSRFLSDRIKCRVNSDMMKDMFRHLQSLPVSSFRDKSTGEHVYRMNEDVGSVSNLLSDTIPQIATLFPKFLFILVIVFYLNWKLALLATLLAPISYVNPYFFRRRLIKTIRRLVEKFEGIYKALHEIFANIYLVKAFGKEDYETKRFEENLTERIDLELSNARLLSISSFSGSILNKVIGGVIALYGGYQVINGIMTLGNLSAVMIYLTQLLGLTKSIGIFCETVLINSVSCQRLGEILDIEPKIRDAQGAADHRILQGKIEFRNVSFGYRKDELIPSPFPLPRGERIMRAGAGFILKDISFSIEPSSKIALVGPSGCGKTTLLTLILRLYDPQEGCVLIDEFDIRNMKLKSLKAQLGIVLQEPFLWNDTVADNILYGAPDAGKEDEHSMNPTSKPTPNPSHEGNLSCSACQPGFPSLGSPKPSGEGGSEGMGRGGYCPTVHRMFTKEDLIKAAKIAEAHDVILNLPKQYDSIIGEGACKISEGQKQRIAIARAIIGRPKILMLDEAMSSLDSETEDKIVDNIKREFRNSTVIIVSHRLSTVRKMDLVYYLEGPGRMNIGTHGDFLARNRNYQELFASQIASFSSG